MLPGAAGVAVVDPGLCLVWHMAAPSLSILGFAWCGTVPLADCSFARVDPRLCLVWHMWRRALQPVLILGFAWCGICGGARCSFARVGGSALQLCPCVARHMELLRASALKRFTSVRACSSPV